MKEWALQNPFGFGFLVFCVIVGVSIIGVAFAIAWAHRARHVNLKDLNL